MCAPPPLRPTAVELQMGSAPLAPSPARATLEAQELCDKSAHLKIYRFATTWSREGNEYFNGARALVREAARRASSPLAQLLGHCLLASM
mmetsp:Transcript_68871/g.199797  ORF Transcript_68871/g.199797 Transcript_68871/m.199797 type:complete len:90 (+) Transcript_68871:150-419(+)